MWEQSLGKIPWKRAWHPSSVFLPGESRGLVTCSPQGRKELDMKEEAQHTCTYNANQESNFVFCIQLASCPRTVFTRPFFANKFVLCIRFPDSFIYPTGLLICSLHSHHIALISVAFYNILFSILNHAFLQHAFQHTKSTFSMLIPVQCFSSKLH